MPERYVVPQFIDVEAKIFGPVTVRQFVIMLVGAMFIFIWYSLFDFSLFVFMTAMTGAMTLVIAFVKINGQTFHYFLLNIFISLKKPTLRVWQKIPTVVKQAKEKKEDKKLSIASQKIPQVKKAKGKSLSEIALIVNTGGYYKGE